MASPSFQRLRTLLHLVPVFGIVPALWTLYGESYGGESYGGENYGGENYGEHGQTVEDVEAAQMRSASRLSVLIGGGCICAIALLGAGATTQASQMASLRFLLASSFVGSGYCLLSIALMFRVIKGQSIRLPGVSQLSRRLP